MTFSPFRVGKLAVGAFAVSVAITAGPASAELYRLTFTTSSQTGTIYFQAPIAGLLPGPITSIWGTETTTGLTPGSFLDSGIPQSIQALVGSGGYDNFLTKSNDNQLLSFVPNVSLTPPTSNLDTTWFSSGGVAFSVADNTILNLFVQPAVGGAHPRPARFWIESSDVNGNLIDANGGAVLLTDLGAPAPTPGAGYLGLMVLALGAAAHKLRQRLAR